MAILQRRSLRSFGTELRLRPPQRLMSERLRAKNAALRAGTWPGQADWFLSGLRQSRVFLYRATGRLLGGQVLGRLPLNWISSVAATQPDPRISERIEEMEVGAAAGTVHFPQAPPGFECFTRSVTLEPTTDFVAVDAIASPRSGLVWLDRGPVLGESYGSLPQLLSWGYAAHDLLTADHPKLGSDLPVLCVPSSGYCHVMLESLPALLRVMERGGPTDILVWSSSPSYVRGIAELLQHEGARRVLQAPGPVRVGRVRVAGRRALSGHFDAVDVARLRAVAERAVDRHGGGGIAENIFVTRVDASRSLANEGTVTDFLVERGFTVVDPGRLSIVQQMAMFQGARLVVGAHGAGLTNLAWCAPGAAVVEILRPERKLDCYARLAHLSGLRYRPQLTGATGHVDLAALAAALHDLTSS